MKKLTSAESTTLRRVLRYLRPRTPLLLLTLLLNLVSVVLSLLIPILIGRGIDCIVAPGQVRFEDLFRILASVAVCIEIGRAHV